MGNPGQSFQLGHPTPPIGSRESRRHLEKGEGSLLGADPSPDPEPTSQAPGAIHGLNNSLQQVQHHWLGDQTWGQFLDTHQHWLQYRDKRTFELMQQTVQHQLEAAQQQSREESSLQYAEWIRQGETKGLKGLFRLLKANELSWQRPYRNIPMADRMRHRMQDWHKLWKPTRDDQPMTRLPLQDQAKQQAAELPLSSGWERPCDTSLTKPADQTPSQHRCCALHRNKPSNHC